MGRKKKTRSGRRRRRRPGPPAGPISRPPELRHFERAIAWMGDERWKEAIPELERFADLVTEPENKVIGYTNLSACYLALERYDEALAALDRAQALQPDEPEMLFNRGVTCATAGRAQEAIEAFRAYSRRRPRQARERELRNTIKRLKRVLKGEENANFYLVERLNEQVQHNADLGDYDLVVAKARRMIAADPQRPEGHFALGIGLLALGETRQALAAFQEARRLDPDQAVTLANIGHIHLELKEHPEAIAAFEQALALDPKGVTVHHKLGVVYEEMGDVERAKAWWHKALALDPGYEYAQRSLWQHGAWPYDPDTELPPVTQRMREQVEWVKRMLMRRKVYREGPFTLTVGVNGFVFEDADNPRNISATNAPDFQVGEMANEDILLFMGAIKMLLSQINGTNTRDVAVLVVYQDDELFGFTERFERGRLVLDDHDGCFVADEVPRLFKVRIDSDLTTNYAAPMVGLFIYLARPGQRGIVVTTLGTGRRVMWSPPV